MTDATTPAKEIASSTGRRVETSFVNIRDRASVEALAATAAERFGQVDVLVNNAGEVTRTLAYEWGPSVRLHCIAPGPIDTRGFKATYDLDMLPGLKHLPIPRFGKPEEVAHAAVFLSSPAASWITGEIHYVAGGQQLYGANQAVGNEPFGRS